LSEVLEFVRPDSDTRLDIYIASIGMGLSRSRVQKLIKDGYILVNDALAKPSLKLQPNDKIKLTVPDDSPSVIIPEDIPLTFVYDDPYIIVVDKPPGLTVYPGRGHPTGTLVNALLSYYPEIARVGSEKRPGIVHRLDAGTSGLMVVARSEFAYQTLVKQIGRRELKKVYLTLVKGHPRVTNGLIDAPVGRHPTNRKQMSVISTGRQALTEYRTLQRFKGFSLLEIQIETGRTHQIRVHMSAMGHSVAGDSQYGGRVSFLERQFLHAHKLGIQHPVTGKYLEFVSELPLDLSDVLLGLEPVP